MTFIHADDAHLVAAARAVENGAAPGALHQRRPVEPSLASYIVGADQVVRSWESCRTRLGKTLQVLDIPPEAHLSTLLQAGMPQPVAETYVEMYAGFASGKIAPRGDRMVQGTTTLDEVIKGLVA